MLDQREEASVGPRDLKKPGTAKWAWQTLSALKRRWELKQLSAQQFEETIDELKEHRAWEIVPPEKPYGSLDAMLRAEIGCTEQKARKRFAVDPTPKRGNPTGSNQHKKESSAEEDSSQVSRAKKNGVGIQTQVYLDRLAKDRPDLLKKVDAGELKPKTAARMAGIVKDKTALEWLRHWWEKATSKEKRSFLSEIDK